MSSWWESACWPTIRMGRRRALDHKDQTPDVRQESVHYRHLLALSRACAQMACPEHDRSSVGAHGICRVAACGDEAAGADTVSPGNVLVLGLAMRVARLIRFRYRGSTMVAHRTPALYLWS